jgi:hypothetical protein
MLSETNFSPKHWFSRSNYIPYSKIRLYLFWFRPFTFTGKIDYILLYFYICPILPKFSIEMWWKTQLIPPMSIYYIIIFLCEVLKKRLRRIHWCNDIFRYNWSMRFIWWEFIMSIYSGLYKNIYIYNNNSIIFLYIPT